MNGASSKVVGCLRDQRGTTQIVSTRMNNVRLGGRVCCDELFESGMRCLEIGNLDLEMVMLVGLCALPEICYIYSLKSVRKVYIDVSVHLTHTRISINSYHYMDTSSVHSSVS